MTNFNITPNFIFCATERELLTLSLADIVNGLTADYKGFSRGNEASIRIPENQQEPRMSHSCILYAEGLRLAHTHPELAKKLVLASLFDSTARAAQWFAVKPDESAVFTVIRKIAENKELNDEEVMLLPNFFKFNVRTALWLINNGATDLLVEVLENIASHEAFKAAERRKE